MQVLYMVENQNQGSPNTLLQKEFDKTRNLFVFLVHLLHQVALYAEVESQQRSSKNLPNQADLSVNIKVAGNSIVWQTIESESFKKAVALVKPQQWLEGDLVKTIFRNLSESALYNTYILEESRDKAKEKEILKYIFGTFIIESESTLEFIDEHFSNWEDEGDMMIGFVLNYLQKPGSIDFMDLVGTEKMKFANRINDLVVKFIRLEEFAENSEMLVMERLYPFDFRAFEYERRELFLDVFEDELHQLHREGFVHRDLRRPSDMPGLTFDNIFLTQTGIRLIDVGISALQQQVGQKLFTRFVEQELLELEAFKAFFLSR